MLIIPAIDLLDGKCVRLTGGSFDNATVYSDDPVSTAQSFADLGVEWIHVVDLDGAKAGHPTQTSLVAEIKRAVKCRVQLGGGLRRLDDVEAALAIGVDRVVMGSALAADVRVAATFFERFGGKIAAGIDTKNGVVAVKGWTQTSAIRGLEFAQSVIDMGCKTIIHTDVGRDGTMSGPNLEELGQYLEIKGADVIASGGVSGAQDLAALSAAGVTGAIIGKAIYEGRVSIMDAVDTYQT